MKYFIETTKNNNNLVTINCGKLTLIYDLLKIKINLEIDVNEW